jgi:hypothetical protein
MAAPPFRYRSSDEDSARWDGFDFRPGDIVISSRSKSGTTWLQMICALLVFQSGELPAPLWKLSPWLDWLTSPRNQVFSQLAAQQHRRFIKTHTPLDGVPLDPRATYIVPGRHPLDLAVSLYHHSANLDRARISRLIGGEESVASAGPAQRPSPREWLLSWIDERADPRQRLDSLPGVMRHLSDAWARQRDPDVDVILVHYDDLVEDLESQMRRLASRLAIDVPAEVWPGLVEAATFDRMRADPERTVPDPAVLKSAGAFFRRGRSGAGRELLTGAELERYHARAADLAPNDLIAWLHRQDPPRESPVQALQRWQDFGASWRVVSSSAGEVTVSMCRCDGGEEVQRLTSSDPELRRWLAGRLTSED